MASRGVLHNLTQREREVLALMAWGMTNAEIATELAISFSTAKTHVSDILARLDVTTREEAVALWKREHRLGRRLGRGLHFLAPGWVIARTAAAGVAIATVVVAGAVVFVTATEDDAPPSEVAIPLDDLEPDTPREFTVAGLGADQYGRPYSLWVVAGDQGGYSVFLGRDPASGCTIEWLPNYQWEGTIRPARPGEEANSEMQWPSDEGIETRPAVAEPGFVGAFKAFCSGWGFRASGDTFFGAAARGLDSFPAAVNGDFLIVSLTQLQLGSCRLAGSMGSCSPPGRTVLVRDVPPPFQKWGPSSAR